MEQSVVPLVPLTLDKPRYLRLDIAALCNAERDLSDFWGKKTSVYACLLEVPISVNDLSIIVLHGLRHEDPTLSLPEVKGMLNHSTIPVVFQAVTDAWTKATQAADPHGSAGEADSADPSPTLSIGVSSGLTAGPTSGSAITNFGNLTLYEFDLLSLRHRHRQEREDRRAAMGAWVLANVNRDSKQRSEPFSLDEVTAWLGYTAQYPPRLREPAAPTPPATVDEVRRNLDVVHLLHRGLYGDNGQGEEE